MNSRMVPSEEQLIADLQSPKAEVRRKAAQELGGLTKGDEREVGALINVMQTDCDEWVREMAYWALCSPANLAILSQNPDWQTRMQMLIPGMRKRYKWWLNLLMRLKLR